jgi:sulfur carrier protein ThiS
MKIRVKLFGTVTKHFPTYKSEHGVVVEIPEGSSVAELIANLGITKSKVGIITVEERVVQADYKLRDGTSVHIYQPISGG